MAEHGYWEWQHRLTLGNRKFVCGYCGAEVHSREGYFGQYKPTKHETALGSQRTIYLCPSCAAPTYIDEQGKQVPGIKSGGPVQGLPPDLEKLYGNIRSSTALGAYTPAVLACRKILMHVAVEKGAQAGLPFTDYVDHLQSGNYIPLDAAAWVNRIRQQGNHANHDVWIATRDEADELLYFTQMLLTFVYEIPGRLSQGATSP